MDPIPGSGLDAAQLDPLCSLDDPTRRQLYDHVVAQAGPVTRDEASRDLGIDRSTVVYHLDRLVEAGLLTTSFARPEGRGGPGAGRPAKHYQRSGRELAVSIPPRDYGLAAELLARAAAADTTGTVRRALDQAAADLGRELTTETDDPRSLPEHLADLGFEPYLEEGIMRLRNCPFHALARDHTALVCGMNLSLLSSVADATGSGWDAYLDPAEARCCVAFQGEEVRR